MSAPKVFGLVGWSGVGKTTLLEKLIAHLAEQGLRVSVIKHTHHRFDVDKPGKDSYRQRQAGAGEVLLVSDQRWALLHENRGGAEPSLAELLAKLSPCDVVFLEGYRTAQVPKLEIWRAEHAEAASRPLHSAADPFIRAVATDNAAALQQRYPECTLPILDLNHVAEIAAFVRRQLQ